LENNTHNLEDWSNNFEAMNSVEREITELQLEAGKVHIQWRRWEFDLNNLNETVAI
jgi:hypothetical protein